MVCVGVPPNVTLLGKWGTERGDDREMEDGKRGQKGQRTERGSTERGTEGGRTEKGTTERENMKGGAQRRGG